MFYYLHFTRPPPSYAHPSQPIKITPNIANDLRTEYPQVQGNGIEICHAWVKSVESASTGEDPGARPPQLGSMSQPKKLMDWTGNSYKEVYVYPPSLVQDGERWHLLLCTRHTITKQLVASINLALAPQARGTDNTSDLGTEIFPVLSSAVTFSLRKRNTDGKQVQNERLMKLPELWGKAVGPLRLVEHISYDLDKKVWDSGVGLSRWLVDSSVGSQAEAKPFSLRQIEDVKNPVILELGAGTGLVSLILSTLLSNHPESPDATVITTDLPSAMEIMSTNVSHNAHALQGVKPQVVVLDWENEELPVEVHGGIDLIVMADVTYNIDSFPALINTLSRLRSCGRPRRSGATSDSGVTAEQPPAILLAYKERHSDERRMWDMVRTIGLQLQEIARVPGAGGNPVEIYEGKFV